MPALMFGDREIRVLETGADEPEPIMIGSFTRGIDGTGLSTEREIGRPYSFPSLETPEEYEATRAQIRHGVAIEVSGDLVHATGLYRITVRAGYVKDGLTWVRLPIYSLTPTEPEA